MKMLMFMMMMVAMNSTFVLAFVAIFVVNTCNSDERMGAEGEYNEIKRESERQRQKVMQKYC